MVKLNGEAFVPLSPAPDAAYAQAPDGAEQDAQTSKIEKLQGQVDRVKEAMSRNIDIAMQNSEDAEGLMLKTQELEAMSRGFNDTAKKARRQQQWRRAKATGMIALIGVGGAAAIIL